jgi:tetratricopeptide (TPR) repeat protein
MQPDFEEWMRYAQTLQAQGHLAQAIQAWDTLLFVESTPVMRAQANFHLGEIYREWDEVFTAQRFLGQAYQFAPDNVTIKTEWDALNRYIAENRAELFEVRERKNSDQIVSLFRIATGLKLLQMDKPAQAYPLMKSRTKIYPNAAVAKHLLTDVIITEDEVNSAIEFLETGGWLVKTQHDLYSITKSGLYTFYTELATLHVANEVYNEASACYEQAYWLDDSTPTNSKEGPLYRKVICDAKFRAWEDGFATLEQIEATGQSDTASLPEGIDPAAYGSAVAEIYGLAYHSTQDKAIGLRAITACKAALALDRKNKDISNLLKSLMKRET